MKTNENALKEHLLHLREGNRTLSVSKAAVHRDRFPRNRFPARVNSFSETLRCTGDVIAVSW